MEGGKAESMLETCAVVPDPPCRRCADSTGSVWVREAAGTHRDDLFTNLQSNPPSQEEIIQHVFQ